MKMVKSLLLGSAAGLVAVAGAQAADLPVKAKPVEYVKVCSLYGAGFYYMPGTDICIKVGGYVRAQAYWGSGNNGTASAVEASGGLNSRVLQGTNDFVYRVRGNVTIDTRQQTEYGTLRTYTLVGFQHDGGNNFGAGNTSDAVALYANRGFIQIAGFTAGKAQSFYDIFSNPAVSYISIPGSDTGDPGEMLFAYTAQFGNGFTGTVSLEDPRRTEVGNAAPNTAAGVGNGVVNQAFTNQWGGLSTTGTFPNQQYGEMNAPDIVGVLRVDQAWGSLQLMGAAHEVSANYYDSTNVASGHPSDKWGFAVGFGGLIKADALSPGDLFSFQLNYGEGTTRYMDFTPGGSGSPYYVSGNSIGTLLYTDGIYGPAGTGIELTTAWNINAAYDHVWNQKWKTSLYGFVVGVSYDSTAKNYIQNIQCTPPAGTAPVFKFANCDPDGNQWGIGSRTQFNINASTYLGVDVLYRRLNTGFAGAVTQTAAFGPYSNVNGGAITQVKDQDAVTATFRIHRDFLP